MNQEIIQARALVLYKGRPARVMRVAEKIEIALSDGNIARVRLKDVALLHPGPFENLDELESGKVATQVAESEVLLAWQILLEAEEDRHDLAELAELIYGSYTPVSAWGAWECLQDGLYFKGLPDAIVPRSPEEVRTIRTARQEREAQAQAWSNFIDRARREAIDPQADSTYLREVEELALGRREDSQVLRELGRSERPESAHALLLSCGYWDSTVVPYAVRLGLPVDSPHIELPQLEPEERLDLTHLPAFAIDDRDNRDPDDAISLEQLLFDAAGRVIGGRIWVHVADVSALVAPDSPIDLEARARGATLYLPDGSIPMMPEQLIQTLGLGLEQISPALSFGLELDAGGEIIDTKIHPSWVRVQRLSYEEADQRLEEEPLSGLYQLAEVYKSRRQDNGALFIDLPEVIVRVLDKRVTIRSVRRLRSRILVREGMLMVGEAVARYAVQHEIAFPYATQEPADLGFSQRQGLADPTHYAIGQEELPLEVSYAVRRSLKRSQVSLYPAPHAGVGLPLYSRATSPLRRYLDLVAHQQLRAHLRGESTLEQEEVLKRLGASEAVIGSVNMAESLGRVHWTLVYLMQNPGWMGEGVLVECNELRGRVIIPELALEVPLHLRNVLPLGKRIDLEYQGCNLSDLEVHFRQR